MRARDAVLAPGAAIALMLAATFACAGPDPDVSGGTPVDHDAQPSKRPAARESNLWQERAREAVVEPISHVFDVPDKVLALAKWCGAHPQREAVNVNDFDEVPNSSWFTNRNHVRAVPPAELALGPDSLTPPAMPWTIKHAKHGGMSLGFQIKDAAGRKWLVKLDPAGYPQLNSGADMVARTLLHAAGYNVPHNVPVRFIASDLTIDHDLAAGKDGERFTAADLDSLLARAATCAPQQLVAMLGHGARASVAEAPSAGACYLGMASLYLPGQAVGPPDLRDRREDDRNDWYTHANRRELRGLYVLCAWLGDWDTEDHQLLDVFLEQQDGLGHVDHYVLDVGASLGAAAVRPKLGWEGYENAADLGWMTRRLLTLGFAEAPWQRIHQETGIPSAGNFTAEGFEPQHFKPMIPNPAFRAMTDRDGYWAAKIVGSFSDAQIAAAVDAARYEDPRTRAWLVQCLIARRDAIARHWFGKVAPLDFFEVKDGALGFHDLAVDLGLAGARGYDARIETRRGRDTTRRRLHLDTAALPLDALGEGTSTASLELAVANDHAAPAHVELTRRESRWVVTHVRHG